jgi:thiamine biosynthesis lipoprotein
MGTSYHVKLLPTSQHTTPQSLEKAVADAIGEVDRAMSTYKQDSELSRLNRHPAGVPFPLSGPLREVFESALEVSRESGGAFDVTVGPLVNAWGFGPDTPEAAPTEAEVAALLDRVGFDKLELTPGGLVKARDDLYCDLSAIAKGYAVDRVALALDALGITRYMVEIGGEVRTRGLNADGVPWRIAIERPDSGFEREAQRIIGLEDISLATSGDYRIFEIGEDGVRRSHTIDPRTGAPVAHSLASASVLHADCARADAYATALMVLGPEDGMRFAEEHAIAALLLARRSDGTFEEYASPAFTRIYP